MSFVFSKSEIEPHKLPIYSTKQINDIKSQYNIYNLIYNLSNSSIFEFIFRNYIVEKNGILKSKNKEYLSNTIIKSAAAIGKLSICVPVFIKEKLINISNQKNKDINGLYLIVSPGSHDDHWILQKIIVSDS
jgi:hypothetical protein